MFKQSIKRAVLSGVAVVLGAAASATLAAEPFTLSSAAFKDGGALATRNAGNMKSNPNCVGDNVSPPLSWTNVPAGTRSLALVMTDPDGRGGLGVVHWVAYGIAPAVTSFAENEVSSASPKFIGGKGTQGMNLYAGPCPPAGTGMHHYTFTLIATDLEPAALSAGMTQAELFAKLEGHSKGASTIIGLFGRP